MPINNFLKNKNLLFAVCICMLTFLFLILPFVIFGENCIITISDNLDSNIPWFKYIRDNQYFFDINTKSTTLDNLSTLYFAGDFTVIGFIYYIFDTFVAYNIVYVICLMIGFASMYALLTKLYANCNAAYEKSVIILVSLIYAALPTFPGYRMAVATLPFGIYLFYSIYRSKSVNLFSIVFAFLFPFFSSFSGVLIFFVGYWTVATIILSIKNRKIESRLLISLFAMCLGAIIANYRLFYMRIFVNEPLNRDLFNLGLILDNSLNIKNFITTFFNYFSKGYVHSLSVHTYIILPLTIIFLFCLFSEKQEDRVLSFLDKLENNTKLILGCLIAIALNCLIIVLNDLNILYSIFKLIIPPLAGLSFARLYILNNVLWYIIFAGILIKGINSRFNYRKITIYIIILLQLAVVTINKTYYQDSCKSWYTNLIDHNRSISYKEFFNEDVFTKIKSDVNYDGEIAVAVGFHPSVLMYNGFNTADGYISVYPLVDALKFKELIQPELDVNDWANKYYMAWWGRRYLYNDELPYYPTREKTNNKISLRINMDVFKNYYNGKYIISRAEVGNYQDLGLKFVGLYSDEASIYDLWLYKA